MTDYLVDNLHITQDPRYLASQWQIGADDFWILSRTLFRHGASQTNHRVVQNQCDVRRDAHWQRVVGLARRRDRRLDECVSAVSTAIAHGTPGNCYYAGTNKFAYHRLIWAAGSGRGDERGMFYLPQVYRRIQLG